MRSQDIRERFLQFFERHGHLRVASASLIPHDDPSLLFTVAGMVPFKAYLAGQRTPPSPRLASCQKCFRGSGLHDDISSVGDTSHHTFFEMLGNWSVGDYFKRGAIEMAWEFLTEDLGLDPGRLLPSIYPEDEESLHIWSDTIGIPRERVSRMADNWWQAGPTGPCGYDSEIYWDYGTPCSCGREDCLPQDECGGDRWLEIWNLVFMEFEQHEDGSRTPLPHPCVDTGMGLERVAALLQGVRSDYENDLLRPLVDGFMSRAVHTEADLQRSFNVLADHLRGATFLLADGVFPANEGRGYVLRRVIRRAALHGRRVGLQGGLAAGVDDLVEVMGEIYPELDERRDHIVRHLESEEAAFARTIEAGAARLEALLGDGKTISGEDAFRLYDTYGVPIDLTTEMAAEQGAVVDRAGFDQALAEQRQRSQRTARRGGFEDRAELPVADFVGYDMLGCDAEVLAIGGDGTRQELAPGEQPEVVVISPTPFYAEAGGQIGDTGELHWEGGGRARVLDSSYAPGGEARTLRIQVEAGRLAPGQQVHARVDEPRRRQVARHHSSTHLLHKALREVLGDTVVQRGSYVGPDYTTFDFSFERALTAGEIAEVERRVNTAIRRNLDRSVAVMPVAEARATGAMALFDEKYGEQVRVVDFGGWARELCGGTHVDHTGDIGAAMIIGETSIGQGKRRIEMLAGEAAERRWREDAEALREASRLLRVPSGELADRVSGLLGQVKKLSRDLEEARLGAPGALPEPTLRQVGAVTLAQLVVDQEGQSVVGTLDRVFAERLSAEGVAAVVGRDVVAVKAGTAAVAAGVHAGDVVRRAAAVAGGRGGGRPEFARGGIADASLREQVMQAIESAVTEALEN